MTTAAMPLLKCLTGKLTFKSLKPPNLSTCNKQELQAYFENSYELNESLFTAFKDETAFYKCPDRLRLPLIFYYGHTAVVYVNKLILAGLLKERINFELEKTLETGVDEMSWDDTENFRMGGSFQWPRLDEVVAYRRQVRQAIITIIQETPLQLPITMESPWWALMMGMEHERIHLETSSVLMRQLPVTMLSKPDGFTYAPPSAGANPGENKLIHLDEREITLGKPKDFPSYGWDNEYGEITVEKIVENGGYTDDEQIKGLVQNYCIYFTFVKVPAFEASQFLVSNAEFLAFVKAGGYNNEELWTEEGWKWREFKQAKHPLFWVCNNGCKSGCGADLASYSHCWSSNQAGENNDNTEEFRYRAMFDVIDMPLTWPVDVNYHEAKAYCAWKGSDYRLMFEAEHNAIRGTQAPPSSGTSCDIIFSGKTKHNHNMAFGSSTPVNLYPANELGFYDVFGNVWQWLEDHFNGLCSDTHALYDDFSSPCFDGKHNIILGGSWISTGDEASRFARFAFRRHFFQHAGFRVARTVENVKTEVPAVVVNTEVYVLGSGVEERKVYLDQDRYKPQLVPSTNIQYHFEKIDMLCGILELEFGFRKSFPVAVAEMCNELAANNGLNTKSALWLGAGAGRGPLVLSDSFHTILATDVVARFIDTAMQIQLGKEVSIETEDGQTIVATQDEGVKPERVTFKQFTWIPNEIGLGFDMTIVTFLERVSQPKAWLLRLAEVTNRNGLVVIASGKGAWGREELEPQLGSKGLQCAAVREVAYSCPEGDQNATVTVWKHA